MNTSKFKYFIMSVAIGGISALIVVGASLMVIGLVSNELRNTSNINRPTLEKIIFYGVPITISGLFLSMLSSGLVYLAGNYLVLKELAAPGKIKTPSSCIGCRHFQGVQYNGVLLVCGMHPYGAESEHCPDHEKYQLKRD